MPLFTHKPTVVTATQWFPGLDVPGVQSAPGGWLSLRARYYVTSARGRRSYLEPGDWVIRELDRTSCGLCEPEAFEANYEPVEEGS